jgi:hypothetical protein
MMAQTPTVTSIFQDGLKTVLDKLNDVLESLNG